jgi:hypothetical protein
MGCRLFFGLRMDLAAVAGKLRPARSACSPGDLTMY